MKAALQAAAVFIAILLFSAWSAPLLFHILPFEYERIMNRTIMVLTLLAVYLFYLRGQEKTIMFFGLSGPGKWNWLLHGFAFGVCVLIVIVCVEMALGARTFEVRFIKHGPVHELTKALITGITVGFIEEWFFRGFLFRSFRKALPLGASIFGVNLCYALVHFLKVGNLQGGAQASFANGLKLMLGVFEKFAEEPQFTLFGCIGLLIFGYLLTYAALWSGSLYLNIGIHAGLVFALRMHGKLVQVVPGRPLWFFGDQQYYNGVVGWLCLLLALVLLRFLIKKTTLPRQSFFDPTIAN